MSQRAKHVIGTNNPDRWMAEITYRNGQAPLVVKFEELEDLDEIVEHGPDWREIEHILITLNHYAPFETEG